MKNNLITIAYASKGRIKNGVDFLFKNKKLKIFSRGSRNLFGYIKKKPNIQIMYMKSKEIIHSLGTGICDIGISGIDLWLESEPSIQSKIKIIKKYDFSHAELCIAIPSIWIDCVNTTDLEEISYDFYNKKKRLMRVATPFKNLTREWLNSKGITQYEIVDSQSSTELCPWNGKSDVISDLVQTGTTLKQNNLKKLDTICKSSAALFVSKNSLKKQNVRKILKLLSK